MNILNIFKKTHSNTIKSSFHNRSEHQWIASDEMLSESFSILEAHIKSSAKVSLFYKSTLFLKVNGSYACALDSNKRFILVFPELFQLLKSSKRMQGIAILMHELGHLVLEHQKNQIDNEIAQIEADLFANEMGLGKYLLEFLYERSRGQQINKRILALEEVSRREV